MLLVWVGLVLGTIRTLWGIPTCRHEENRTDGITGIFDCHSGACIRPLDSRQQTRLGAVTSVPSHLRKLSQTQEAAFWDRRDQVGLSLHAFITVHRLPFFLALVTFLDFLGRVGVSRRAVPLWIATCSVLSLLIRYWGTSCEA